MSEPKFLIEHDFGSPISDLVSRASEKLTRNRLDKIEAWLVNLGVTLEDKGKYFIVNWDHKPDYLKTGILRHETLFLVPTDQQEVIQTTISKYEELAAMYPHLELVSRTKTPHS